MRMISKAVLAGVGTIALAGAALAAGEEAHVMKVALPDGSVAQVRYHGDVAPKLVVVPSRIEFVPVARLTAVPVAAASVMDPFAMFDRIAAQMDMQMNAMLRQAAALSTQAPAMNGQVNEATLRQMPAGTVSYSFVSTSDGTGTCSRSVQVTSLGAGQAPKVVSQSAGDCTAMSRPVTPAVRPVQPAAPQPRIIPASAIKPAESAKVRETI